MVRVISAVVLELVGLGVVVEAEERKVQQSGR